MDRLPASFRGLTDFLSSKVYCGAKRLMTHKNTTHKLYCRQPIHACQLLFEERDSVNVSRINSEHMQ